MDTVGKSDQDLCGVRYWIQTYGRRIPQFEVFIYQGSDDRGFHWFKARKDGSPMCKSMESITADTQNGTFKPFLIDIRKLTVRLDGT